MIASPAVYAQSSQEVPNLSPSARVASSLEQHKAILIRHFSSKRTTQYDEDMNGNTRTVESPQFASPVEFDSTKSLTGEGAISSPPKVVAI